MIIDRNTHIYMQSTLYPNKNWTDNENYYVIDETKEENQELIQKIKEHAPYMELVIKDEKLVDIIPTERPLEPKPDVPKEPTVKELQKQILELQEYILNQEYEKLLNEGGI